MIAWLWRYVVTVMSDVRAIFTHAILMSIMDKADYVSTGEERRDSMWKLGAHATLYYSMIFYFLCVWVCVCWLSSLDACDKNDFLRKFYFSLSDSHTLSPTFFSSFLFMYFIVHTDAGLAKMNNSQIGTKWRETYKVFVCAEIIECDINFAHAKRYK